MERDKIEAGLRAMQEIYAQKVPNVKNVERLIDELRRVYAKTVGIPEYQVNVEVDIFNDIIRVTDVMQPTIYFNLEDEP